MAARGVTVSARAEINPAVVLQHVEEAAVLHSIRTALTVAPHAKLHHLRRFDDRLDAHLDGVAVAGAHGWAVCQTALANPSPGAVFVAAMSLLERKEHDALRQLYALAEVLPEARTGLMASLGWSEPDRLRGLVAGLLTSGEALHRLLGVAACAMHRVDSGTMLADGLRDDSPVVRARAVRMAAELGRQEFVPTIARLCFEDDVEVRAWAAWAAVLLGDRHAALELLVELASAPGPFRLRAWRLALQCLDRARGETLLDPNPKDYVILRRTIEGMGLIGEARCVPWLITQMEDDVTARVAGEAFCLITGIDLAALDLERKPPAGRAQVPSDDAQEDDVESDPDDGLPWPEAGRVAAWWAANSLSFQHTTRYFMGAPLGREICDKTLREGYQRQRIAAAFHRTLLNRGTPLFEWRAPAKRQQRLLAQMS